MQNCRYWSTENCEMEVCSMKCTDLCNDTIKNTGIHFPYKEKQNEKIFLESTTKIQNVLKVWQMHRPYT